MKIKIIIICFLLLSSGLFSPVSAQRKNRKQQPAQITLVSKVVGTDGQPIVGAYIYTNEGKDISRSDQDGTFTVKAETKEMVLIEADGYESVVLPAAGINKSSVTLVASTYQSGRADEVNVPFVPLKRRNIIGAVDQISIDKMRDIYYADDWRGYLQTAGTGIFDAANIRYAGNVVVIDGMMKGDEGLSFADYLSPDEIESISVLKDASSRILYGGTGQGVINIRTKRGTPLKNYLNVRYEYSLARPVSYPDYMGAADYMTLYNEARRNDGLTDRYDEMTIQNTRIGFDPVQYPDVDFYNSDFLRKVKQSHKAVVEMGGGNRIASYYFMLGYDYDKSLLKLGEAAGENDNTFRARGNVDVKITDYLRAKVDMTVVLNSNYASKGNFWEMASTRRPNQFAFLIPIDRVAPEDQVLVEEARQQKSLIYGKYLVAGDQVYTTNIYGDKILAGYDKLTNRAANVNIGFDVDLKAITPGLTFSTYAGIDNNNVYMISQTNKYAVYTPSFEISTTSDVDRIHLTKQGENNFVGSQSIGKVDMNRKIAWYNVLNYSRVFAGEHDVNVTATHRMSSYVTQGQIYSKNQLDYALRANYMYRNRYIAEIGASAIASPFLPADHRWGIASSYALGWIMSEENFMKNSGIDFLKLKVSFANLKSDPANYNLSRDTYKIGEKHTYNDGSGSNNFLPVTLGNPDLTFANVYELNAGFEMALFERSLYAEANFFQRRKTGLIVQPVKEYLGVIGGSDFIMSRNYGISEGRGFEISLSYDKRFDRDWSLSVNAGMVYYKAKNLKVDELDYGPGMEYNQQTGKSLSALWGYVADGFYTQEEIDRINDPSDQTIAKPSFGTVQAGDMKYLDLNDDGVINDRDQKVIGDLRSTCDYRLAFTVRWRNFSLYAQMRAQTGGSQLMTGSYYQVYGEMKYPSYLKSARWAYDPERGIDTRETASYPRLTTTGNTHNFKNSTFWIAATDFIKIPVVQLTYHLSDRIARKIGMKNPNVYFRANNLLTLAPEKEKLLLNVGGEPAYTWFALGFKANF